MSALLISLFFHFDTTPERAAIGIARPSFPGSVMSTQPSHPPMQSWKARRRNLGARTLLFLISSRISSLMDSTEFAMLRWRLWYASGASSATGEVKDGPCWIDVECEVDAKAKNEDREKAAQRRFAISFWFELTCNLKNISLEDWDETKEDQEFRRNSTLFRRLPCLSFAALRHIRHNTVDNMRRSCSFSPFDSISTWQKHSGLCYLEIIAMC